MIPNIYQEARTEQKLETFLTLCQTMNYRRAAEACSLTQPAVTKQIQALEAYYGVRLFTYDGRRLQKTLQGELLEQPEAGALDFVVLEGWRANFWGVFENEPRER